MCLVGVVSSVWWFGWFDLFCLLRSVFVCGCLFVSDLRVCLCVFVYGFCLLVFMLYYMLCVRIVV